MARIVSGLRKQRLYSSSASLPKKLRPCLVLASLYSMNQSGSDAHQLLGHRRRLDVEEPVPGKRRPVLVDVVEQMMLRNDVEDRRALHALGMIEAHAVRHARAAVVAGHHEGLEAELLHHLDLVLRHGAERIVLVLVAAGRLREVAIAAQIGRDHGELLREPRRELVPGQMRERIAVQQQQRRPLAAVQGDDARPAGVDLGAGEAFHHVRSPNFGPQCRFIRQGGLRGFTCLSMILSENRSPLFGIML